MGKFFYLPARLSSFHRRKLVTKQWVCVWKKRKCWGNFHFRADILLWTIAHNFSLLNCVFFVFLTSMSSTEITQFIVWELCLGSFDLTWEGKVYEDRRFHTPWTNKHHNMSRKSENMPSNGTPAEENHIKPHKPWSQEAIIHLFQAIHIRIRL